MSADQIWTMPVRSDEGHLLFVEVRSAAGGETRLVVKFAHPPQTTDTAFAMDAAAAEILVDALQLSLPSSGVDRTA